MRLLLIAVPARTSTTLVACAVAAFLALGCESVTLPDGPATLQGNIVGAGSQIPFGGENRIWVKENPDSPCGIVFTVTDETEIAERQPDGSLEERSISDLEVGETVSVWTQIVAESCPGQASADAIELLPRLES